MLLAAACSHTSSVEAMPNPDRIFVTFPTREGAAHEITDATVLARIQGLLNADLDGWRDIRSYGKSPIAHAALEVDAGGERLSIWVGDAWLQRGTWLKDIPEARERELLGLVGAAPGP